jgi:hypothetical protein
VGIGARGIEIDHLARCARRSHDRASRRIGPSFAQRSELKDGLTILDLKPGNMVAKLRQVIRDNGYTLAAGSGL